MIPVSIVNPIFYTLPLILMLYIAKFDTLNEFRDISAEESYLNRDLEKACLKLVGDRYQECVFPYTFAGRQLGNSYTGSLWFALLSLIAESANNENLGGDGFLGDRALLFSYGSGLAATMFSCIVDGSLKEQAEKVRYREDTILKLKALV